MQTVHPAPCGLRLPTLVSSKPIPAGLAFWIQDYLDVIQAAREGRCGRGAVHDRAMNVRALYQAYRADGVL